MCFGDGIEDCIVTEDGRIITSYFEDALSDFIHEMASAGAIRHLTDAGYSIEQIMDELDYPTPRERVEQTVYRYMTASGILLAKLPIETETMRRYGLKKLP